MRGAQKFSLIGCVIRSLEITDLHDEESNTGR